MGLAGFNLRRKKLTIQQAQENAKRYLEIEKEKLTKGSIVDVTLEDKIEKEPIIDNIKSEAETEIDNLFKDMSDNADIIDTKISEEKAEPIIDKPKRKRTKKVK